MVELKTVDTRTPNAASLIRADTHPAERKLFGRGELDAVAAGALNCTASNSATSSRHRQSGIRTSVIQNDSISRQSVVAGDIDASKSKSARSNSVGDVERRAGRRRQRVDD